MNYDVISVTNLPAPTVWTATVTIRAWEDGTYTLVWGSDAPLPEQVTNILDGATTNLVHTDLAMAVTTVALLARCAATDYHAALAECWDITMGNAIGNSLEYYNEVY